MKYLFSQSDYDELVGRTRELEQKLKDSNKEAIASTTESSETWHDNWGFEEGVRQSRMLSNQLGDLHKILASAKIVGKPDRHTLLGYRIKFKLGSKKREIIIGSYFSFSKSKKVVSYSAPIIQALSGLKPGQQIKFGSKQKILTLLDIKPFPEYFIST